MRQRSTNTVQRHAADERLRLSDRLLMSDRSRLSDHSLREHKANGGVTCHRPRRTARRPMGELPSCFALPSATAQLRETGNPRRPCDA